MKEVYDFTCLHCPYSIKGINTIECLGMSLKCFVTGFSCSKALLCLIEISGTCLCCAYRNRGIFRANGNNLSNVEVYGVFIFSLTVPCLL